MALSEKTFIPKLFIGIGATSAFYTLRETYLHEVVIGNRVEREVWSFHHFNLSQDADEAVKKAQDAALMMGLECSCTRADIDRQMRDIKRATAEEITQREQRQIEMEEINAAEIARVNAINIGIVMSGRFAHGQFSGQPFCCAPRGLLTWMVDKLPEFEEGGLMYATASQILKTVPHLLLPKANPNLHIGEIGKRREFKVTVVRSYSFGRQCFSGYGSETVYITTMVTEEKACIVVFSTSFGAEVGEELLIKATVKEHGEYKKQAQTTIQRVTLLEKLNVSEDPERHAQPITALLDNARDALYA